MTTNTRARAGRTTGDTRRPAPARSTYVDGANALQLDYLDDLDEDANVSYVDTPRRVEPVPTYRPRRRGRSAPSARPVAPPLPISLPRAPFLILMVSLVVIGVAGVLVLNTKINENAFRLDALHNQQTSLDL